jgi:hypothetical protein
MTSTGHAAAAEAALLMPLHAHRNSTMAAGKQTLLYKVACHLLPYMQLHTMQCCVVQVAVSAACYSL